MEGNKLDFVIFYFSGTGSTELICKELKICLERRQHTVELISIENVYKIKQTDFTNKIIGFGYPVYKFTFPDIFLELFSLFNELANENKCFQLCTYARFTADVFYDFSKKLHKKKFMLIA